MAEEWKVVFRFRADARHFPHNSGINQAYFQYLPGILLWDKEAGA
jgi:hypothetical protein